MTIRHAAIGPLLLPVSTWSPSQELRDGTFPYIDLGAVDNDEKIVRQIKDVPFKDAPSRARQLVKSGDILVSTVRPNLNGIAKLDARHDGATASTGFCVLRPNASAICPNYLFHWLKSPPFVAEMVRQSTGASYPAVSDRIIHSSLIPLPPLDEQRRIAAILDQADDLRRKRREALERLDELFRASFTSEFCGEAPSDWPEVQIVELCKSIRTGPFGSQLLHSEFTDRGVAVLGIDNAVENEFRWAERRYISEAKYRHLKRYRVYPRDLLITIMATCGRVAIVPDDIPLAINTKHLCCLTLDERLCLPEFLHACFLLHPSVLHQLGVRERGAVMPGLNMGLIKETRLALPPISLQRAFAARVDEIDKLKAHHRAHLARLDALFASLQHRAFRGDLSAPEGEPSPRDSFSRSREKVASRSEVG